MSRLNEIDVYDEALKIVYLVNATSLDEKEISVEMSKILSQGNVVADPVRYAAMLERLSPLIKEQSFGQILTRAIRLSGENDGALAQQHHIPSTVLSSLKEDSIYPNSVPVLILRRLLTTLQISFEVAKNAIWKTYEILQKEPDSVLHESNSLEIAYRKDFALLEAAAGNSYGAFGSKKLHENKYSLTQYLSLLQEEMVDGAQNL